MCRQRIRIRFSKTGDLRLISHRDLVRVWERLFRRASLKLAMSEGFHPKVKMSFPSALGLGIAGLNEVMEVELAELLDAPVLRQRLEPLCPPGLQILEITAMPEGSRKPALVSTTYEVAVPVDQYEATDEAIQEVMSQEELLIQREGRKEPINVLADLAQLALLPEQGVLRIQINASRTASVRPQEVLNIVGLGESEAHGRYLTRTVVELK